MTTMLTLSSRNCSRRNKFRSNTRIHNTSHQYAQISTNFEHLPTHFNFLLQLTKNLSHPHSLHSISDTYLTMHLCPPRALTIQASALSTFQVGFRDLLTILNFFHISSLFHLKQLTTWDKTDAIFIQVNFVIFPPWPPTIFIVLSLIRSPVAIPCCFSALHADFLIQYLEMSFFTVSPSNVLVLPNNRVSSLCTTYTSSL
jgi:hypothetical protein